MSGVHMRNTQNGGGTKENLYDDVAVNDTSGTVNTAWPGEGYVVLRQPHRDGTTTQLTSNTGSGDNADSIGVNDDRTPVSITQPAASTAIGQGTEYSSALRRHQGFVGPTAVPQKDTYTIKELPFDAGLVSAISVFSRAKGGSSLTSNARHLLKPPAQLEIQSGQLALESDAPGPHATHFNENPNTGIAFTVSEVNAMELGIQFEA